MPLLGLLRFGAARLRHEPDDGEEVIVVDEVVVRKADRVVKRRKDLCELSILEVVALSNDVRILDLHLHHLRSRARARCGGGGQSGADGGGDTTAGEARLPPVEYGRRCEHVLRVPVRLAEARHRFIVGAAVPAAPARAPGLSARASAAANLAIPRDL